MPELDFQSDQFLTLLTDALRAGPGSPEWHEAVAVLRARQSEPVNGGGGNGSIGDVDELRLLVAAREDLESGKEFRSIRPGPGFTRRLMTSIEQEPHAAPKRVASLPTLIALISGILLVVAVIVIVLLVSRSSGTSPAIDALTNTYFVNTLLQTSFDGPLPEDFRPIGSLALDPTRGLRPAPDQTGPEQIGGGVLWSQAVRADQPAEIQATLRVTRPADGWIAQVFVTDDPTFSDDRGTSPHEFAWLYQPGHGQAKVISPGGKVEAQRGPARERGTINLRIAIGSNVAIVEEGGKRLWAGPHGLDTGRSRYIGLRFLRATADAGEPGMAFTSLKVQTP